MNDGLHQGSVLNPLLFAAVMDVVSSDDRSGLTISGVDDVMGQSRKFDLVEDLMVDGETYECVKSFCYLGDTLDRDGGADLAATARIRNGWVKFRELFPFLTSRSPPLEMKGRVYASCVRSSMSYGRATRPLLVDVGLKFERAEMQMIRWMCVSH